jgi:multiple sugar transport system substrate-binding protein
MSLPILLQRKRSQQESGSHLKNAAGWLLLSALLLTACLPTPLQAFIPHVTETAAPTKEPGQTAVLTRTAAPQPTTVATITPTLSSVQQIPSGALTGLQVQLWHPWTDTTQTYLDLLAAEFNAGNEWGIKVVPTSMGSSSELTRRMETPPYPDLVVSFPEQALAWEVKSLALVDLKNYIYDPNFGWKADDLLDFPKVFWELGQADGRQVGLPAESSLLFLLYNTTWAKELGFNNPPATPEDFRQQACAAAKANRYDKDTARHGTGGWLVDTGALSMVAWAAAFDGSLGPDQKDQYRFSAPQVKNAFTFLNSLYNSGCAWTGRDTEPYDYFAGRYALFTTISLENLLEQTAAMNRLKSTDGWTMLPYPSVSGKTSVTAYGSIYYIIQSTPERQLAAWLFLRWISAPEQDIRLVRGSGVYPVRLSSLTRIDDYRREHPQWSAALSLLPKAVAVPKQSSWRVARAIIQDAAWQIFQTETKPEQIQQILDQMDNLAAEVMQRTP